MLCKVKLNICIILQQTIIVYRMGRLCGAAHEISGIKAPIFLHGWVGGGMGVVGWVVQWGGDGGVGWWVAVVAWVVVVVWGWWWDGGNLMKNLKYEHQNIFPLLGRVKLNFR